MHRGVSVAFLAVGPLEHRNLNISGYPPAFEINSAQYDLECVALSNHIAVGGDVNIKRAPGNLGISSAIGLLVGCVNHICFHNVPVVMAVSCARIKAYSRLPVGISSGFA